MKKVLILVYYWPPAGGGGVQRWLKISAYLKKFGWQAIIYTAEDADYPIVDTSLEKEVDSNITVLRQPIFEVRKLYKKFTSKKKNAQQNSADEIFYINPKERSVKQNLSIWIRGNFFIPDARAPWIKPSVRYLNTYLKKNPVDAIISSGPPHSMHMIALKIKAKHIPWVADFRDPWTQIEYYDKLMLTGAADRKHKRLEKLVFQSADAIVNVAPHWNSGAKAGGAKKTATITNGFDKKDFLGSRPKLQEGFHLLHAGTLANDRNPHLLWKVLEELSADNPQFKKDLKIEVIGKTSESVLVSAKQAGLNKQLISSGYVDHAQAIKKMQSAQVLLLLINDVSFNAQGRIPGKLFEYLAAKRPILLIGPPDGDSADIIRKTKSGEIVDFSDREGLKQILLQFYTAYRNGSLDINSENIHTYSRENTAKQYVDLLSELSRSNSENA